MRLMQQSIVSLAMIALLAACHGGKPTGQVVAKVAGEEITATELRLEMAQLGGGGGADPAALQQQALGTLVTRKLLMREAVKRKLDASPEGKAASRRARELALVELLNAKLVSQQPADMSDNAVNKYIVAHPSQFANRKLITANQLTIQTGDASLGAKLTGMGELPAVVAYLVQNKIPFVRAALVIDTAQLSAEGAATLAALQTNALYAPPAAGGALRVLRIMAAQDAPLTGDEARNAALRMMQAARARTALGAVQQIVTKGKAAVWVDPAFAPG
jgi:EpsD family peptidyl-prolyl cis-trans isomerase